MNRTVLSLLLIVAFAAAACSGTSPEAIRKAAQANADKYIEFMKVGDYDGAYQKTLHADYKRQLPLDTFVKYRQGVAATVGTIESYQVVHYDADVDHQSVTLEYSIKYSKMPEIGTEIVKMRLEGTEWRVMSVEPKLPKKAVAPPEPQYQNAPPKTEEPAPAPPAPGSNKPK